MSEFKRETVNLEQFLALCAKTSEKINILFHPSHNTFTVTLIDGYTTYTLYTQKNHIRSFKNMSAVVKALQLVENETQSLNLLIAR
jgi:hypothetical protein